MREIRNALTKAKLTVYDYDNNEMEIPLTLWQMDALAKTLGLCVSREEDGLMEVILAPREYVEKYTKDIPEYTFVKVYKTKE